MPKTLTICAAILVGALLLSSKSGLAQMDQRQAENREAIAIFRDAKKVFGRNSTAALAEAACSGNLVGLQEALSQGAKPNAVGRLGLTPLAFALRCRQYAAMEALMRAGADPNARIGELPGQPSIVYLAAGLSDSTLLKSALAHGGNPDSDAVGSNETALSSAALLGIRSENWENYYLLIKFGADINKIHNNWTMADWMLPFHRYDKLSELIDFGYCVRLDEVEKSLDSPDILEREQEQWQWVEKLRKDIPEAKRKCRP